MTDRIGRMELFQQFNASLFAKYNVHTYGAEKLLARASHCVCNAASAHYPVCPLVCAAHPKMGNMEGCRHTTRPWKNFGLNRCSKNGGTECGLYLIPLICPFKHSRTKSNWDLSRVHQTDIELRIDHRQ